MTAIISDFIIDQNRKLETVQRPDEAISSAIHKSTPEIPFWSIPVNSIFNFQHAQELCKLGFLL